jgi:hypothetical protein
MMKKLGLAALLLMPFAAGCYAYHHPYHRHYYGPPRAVYVAPPPPRAVYVSPPPARVY